MALFLSSPERWPSVLSLHLSVEQNKELEVAQLLASTALGCNLTPVLGSLGPLLLPLIKLGVTLPLFGWEI